MSGNDLVRSWKDPDERGDSAHPAGEISLDDLSGAGEGEMRLTVLTVTPVTCHNESMVLHVCIPPRSVCFAACPWG